MTGYFQNGGTTTLANVTLSTDTQDVSAAEVVAAGNLILQQVTLTKTGDTSSLTSSLGVGQNAGLLATSASLVDMSNGSVSTTGLGSAGVFATGAGTSITLAATSVTTTGDDSAGAAASAGGALLLAAGGNPLAIATSGTNSAGLLVQDQASSISAVDVVVTTSGSLSAAIEANGTLVDNGSTFTAGNGAGVLEHGTGNVSLTHATVTAPTGVLMDASGSTGPGGAQLLLYGSTLDATAGDAFDVAGITATIQVQFGTVTATSGTLLAATGGAHVSLDLTSIAIAGAVRQDATSSVTVALSGADYTGSVDIATLTVSPGSIWTSTGTSALSQLATMPVIIGGSLQDGYAAVAGGTLSVGTATGTILTEAGSTDAIAIGAGTVHIDSGGTDTIQLGSGNATVFATGSATIANTGARLLFVTGAASDTLQAGAGSDTVFAGVGGGSFAGGTAGHNVLAASTGNTTLIGAVSGDLAFGGASGNDLLVAGSGAETLVAGGGADTLVGGTGPTVMFGGTGADTLFGSTAGHDTVVLHTGTNVVVDTGPNAIFAGAGPATVFGATSGPDAIVAGSGALLATLRDGGTVFAGSGSDTVFCDLAHDVFVATNGVAGGHELIEGFKNGSDTILLSGYAPSGITQTVTGGNTVLTLSDHTTITLVGITSLSPLSLHG